MPCAFARDGRCFPPGALGQGGLGFGRQAFVGLSNARFGRLTMGRHYSVLHTTLSANTEGGLIWGHALNYFRDGTVLRLDNSRATSRRISRA